MSQSISKIITNPADKKAIRDALSEISKSMSRIEGERTLISEAIKEVSDKYLLSKKTFRRMAKVYHNQNFTKEVEEHEEFETLYENITSTATPSLDSQQ